MDKEITQEDGKWLFGSGVLLIIGLWTLWNADISKDNIVFHLKFVYSVFLTLAIFISVYYIIFKMEDKRNGKKK